MNNTKLWMIGGWLYEAMGTTRESIYSEQSGYFGWSLAQQKTPVAIYGITYQQYTKFSGPRLFRKYSKSRK